ncbi:hypothetical protein TNCV_1733191 [Trichonephila clavipes]|nr:hypothetical protein TNCV_1733191 [Trichonephila clavipes]
MDDNAWTHWTLAVEELLKSEDITRMDWTAYSTDLNPIEHVVVTPTARNVAPAGSEYAETVRSNHCNLENALVIRDVEYPRCLDSPEQRVFDDMLRCRP